MKRLAKVAALAASTAVAAEAVGDVWGYTTFSCTDEIAFRYDTVAEACADHGIKAYMDSDEGIFPQCRVCDDDDDDGGAGSGGGGGGAAVPNYKCGDDEIGGGETPCEPCGEGEVPNGQKTDCEECEWGEHPLEPGRCNCDQASVDALFKSRMGGLQPEPFERFERYQCQLYRPVARAQLSTKDKQQKCHLEMPKFYTDVFGTLAVGHSHPKFAWREHEGLKCGPFTITGEFVIDLIEAIVGESFSEQDMNYAERHDKPLYLAVPSRTHLEVYRKDSKGEWAIEIL